MEIVVTGRNVEVPDHFRVHVAEKIARLERYDHKIVRMEVELFHEPNRRQAKNCQRVEITGRGCGPIARAEAAAPDFYTALDKAIGKLEARLRRAHDRRIPNPRRARSIRTMREAREPVRLGGVGTALLEPELTSEPADQWTEQLTGTRIPQPRKTAERLPGRIVRSEEYTAKPMSVDDALSQMELNGRDFYLFACAETGMPSVVYRRNKGYDYGVIRLT